MKNDRGKNTRWMVVAAVVVAGMVFLCGCERNASTNRLRLVNALPVPALLVLRESEAQETVVSARLEGGQASDYHSISRGRYALVCRIDGRDIAKQDLILGTGSWYTAVAAGLPEPQGKLPAAAPLARALRFFEGEEAVAVNRFIPQWQVLRDNIRGARESAYVKFVNLAAGLGPFAIHSAKETIVDGLAYPSASELTRIEAGKKQLTLDQQGRKLAHLAVNLRAGSLYTGLILGSVRPARPPRLVMLSNPSRSAAKRSAPD